MSSKYNIKQSTIKNQDPGFSKMAWMGVIGEMDSIAEATDGIITGDHTFPVVVPQTGFMEVYNLPEKSDGPGETTGDIGGLKLNFSHTIFIPGDDIALQEALKELINTPMLLLVQDGNEGGPKFQYGSEQNPAYIQSVNKSSGNLGNGVKGYELSVKSVNRFEYQGTISIME